MASKFGWIASCSVRRGPRPWGEVHFETAAAAARLRSKLDGRVVPALSRECRCLAAPCSWPVLPGLGRPALLCPALARSALLCPALVRSSPLSPALKRPAWHVVCGAWQ